MEILRYTAFANDSRGGNPAGVVLDATGLDSEKMAEIAAEVGYSETAFLFPVAGEHTVARYFSPRIEVPFCGHATIAAAVAHARLNGPGVLHLATKAGHIEVRTSIEPSGSVYATLVSVPPRTAQIQDDDLAALLAALDWSPDELDPGLPPLAAYAGAWHPVIGAASRERLADLRYDEAALLEVMERNDWATVDLVWRESEHVFHTRNPFPTGGVFEDPATGAAAAAFGGYLRELGLVRPPARVTIHQGVDMGRPGVILVDVPAEPNSGIAVSGTAVQL
ncbi:Trans-2,3-dihydro-3-hydroxyanthranilate isomeras e [Micromonospora saelicesensis]|uniref:Trans-2,3-dihydro-3-hydroxyanthranilate isomeras e n=1 Tax=Micromonospora saelicesensis TaxID=285676 RepID=A0ABX9CM37_9ACTN|nr:PhzF family phenazine biosynthesis isomerase [Micromonospora saelicesensis]RAO01891.1 Trans-2,3-dihydro-3-hydroxyanthranilate isomeras e [Micromonospora saelicesensis]RAO50119.1 Trans-2,3-dihydro-3-hydroxyanthranilate isomeras e [Micromonospora saelicesensis]RAO57163.1 Trans-2,3-dihydro-3-hydroxyanthranilate isomeras e [Micromonospora saelicesensis]